MCVCVSLLTAPGKRVCPGQRLAIGEGGLALAVLLQCGTLRFVNPAMRAVPRHYGLVTQPAHEYVSLPPSCCEAPTRTLHRAAEPHSRRHWS